MKTCLLCNTDNADDAVTCVACGEATFGATEAAVANTVDAMKASPAPQEAPVPKRSKR
ncbi:MAG TPA: hypothetical protein VL494_13635 [Steroidobacteraceae bacterium]|jgi:hypothetical protein|nr:hypothetical protein [Steroidobacteraceae bacterium]